MDELDARLSQLKLRGEKAASERARALATQESAREKVTETARELQRQFGVSSVSQAQTLLEELSKQASDKLNEAQRLLESVENG